MSKNQSATRNILILDKNEEAVQAVTEAFSEKGYIVYSADSGRSGLRAIDANGLPDLAIVDTNLKYRMSGYEFCRHVQKYSDVPIIMTSEQQDPGVAAFAIENYAEDFVPKPYDVRILMVRARRLLARFRPKQDVQPPVTVDFSKREVLVDDQTVKLTPTETKLLHILLRQAEETLTTDFIMRRLWPLEPPDPSKLRVNVYRLRSKINQAASDANFIHSERGVGYGWSSSNPVG